MWCHNVTHSCGQVMWLNQQIFSKSKILSLSCIQNSISQSPMSPGGVVNIYLRNILGFGKVKWCTYEWESPHKSIVSLFWGRFYKRSQTLTRSNLPHLPSVSSWWSKDNEEWNGTSSCSIWWLQSSSFLHLHVFRRFFFRTSRSIHISIHRNTICPTSKFLADLLIFSSL
jgi:hypothetical protein